MSLRQRVPELEATSDERESAVSASGESDKFVPQEPEDAENSKSWWHRMFGE